MNRIIRKRVLALLSAVGLAGSTASATAQVVKGADEADKTKTESKIKYDKNKKATTAATHDANHKDERTNADAASKDAAKMSKAHTETAASKHNSQIKLKKGASETNAAQKETWVKGGKTAAGANASDSEANKKANQSAPK
jgi:hypothetical protein